MQPEKLSEDEFININEESGCDRRDEGVPEEVTLAKTLHIKGTLRCFMRLKVQKIKCWKLIQI